MSARTQTLTDPRPVDRPMSLDPPATATWERLRRHGQEHVLRFWDELEPKGREQLLSQLRFVDLDLIDRLVAQANAPASESSESIEPAPVLRLDEQPPRFTRAEGRALGERLLREGKVGVFLVAGGQGSRLGFAGPKGCLPFGLLSNRTLFELHAQKIRRLRETHGAAVPWYILTSATNDAETRGFFAANGFFGLPSEDVLFLEQTMLPAVDTQGRLLLAARDSLFLSPNGHGGAYTTFSARGGLEDARRRGIEHIFYFQVDNALISCVDPEFIGLHALTRSEMSLKVLEKSGPHEKIGVVALRGGRPVVVEYSDLPSELAEARDERRRLVFGAGSIAIHAFGLDFFERVAIGSIELPYHIARKEIETIDDDGGKCRADGMKFETFVFDALSFAERFLHVEVARKREFAPVKNRSGVDSLDSARELVLAEHIRWMREGGVEVTGRVEISPLVALGSEDLRERLAPWKGKTLSGDVRVECGPDGRVVVTSSPPGGRSPLPSERR